MAEAPCASGKHGQWTLDQLLKPHSEPGMTVGPTLLTNLALFAQEDSGPSPFTFWAPFVVIGVLFYFLLIRPQRQEQAKRQAMLAAVKKNDRVITAGGVYGVVTNVHAEADEVTVKVDEATNTKLRLTLGSITRVLSDEPSNDTSK